LKELKNKGGCQAKEFGQGHFACFSAFQTRFALPATKLLSLCSSNLTYLKQADEVGVYNMTDLALQQTVFSLKSGVTSIKDLT
jgi:hypothetical protein